MFRTVGLLEFYEKKHTENFDVSCCGYDESEQIRYTLGMLFGIKYDDVFIDEKKNKRDLLELQKDFL